MDSLFQNSWAVGTAVVSALTVFGLAIFFVSRYKRCPANKILVISGKVGDGNAAKCISGGGAFIIPVIQEYDFLDLSPMSLDIALSDALSLENIRIAAPTTVTVAISHDPAVQKNAAVRLLGLDINGIRKLSDNVIVGQMRQVIASMSIQDINRDRELFLKKIEESLEPELNKIGLTVLNVNIKDIKDDSGYIEATGRKASAQAVNQANADVADQERQGAIRIAVAKQEQEIKVAEADRSKEIGIKNAEKEQAIQLATYTKEQEIGVAEAQKDKAVRVAEFTREQTITVATAEAAGAKGKADAEVIKAEALRKAEVAKAEADGAIAIAKNEAQARAAEAYGKRVEQEQRAELEAVAKAESAKKIVDAEATARQTVIAAEAEAKAIFAKYKAEADGTLAKLQAQAEGEKQIALAKAAGMKALVDAAGDATAAYRLLTIDQIPAVAKAASDAVQNIKFDKVIVWGQGEGSEIPNFLTGLAKGVVPLMETLGQITDVKIPGLKTPGSTGSISTPAE